MNLKKTILIPQINILLDTSNYWAAFYCSILKTIRYQKNLDSVWGENNTLKEYKGELRESGFFSNMKNKIKNHAFEYVMADFLKTKDGIGIFKDLCANVLNDYNLNGFDIKLINIFKVGTDTEIFDAKAEYQKSTLTMLLPKGIKALPTSVINGYNLNETLKFSDLFIIISDGNETFGFVGEVEGHHGEKLFRNTFFKENPIKDKYCTFCIGVSDRKNYADKSIKDSISLVKDESIGRWMLHFSKSHYYVRDYYYAIENIQNLIEGHFGYMNSLYDEGHVKILDLIKTNWNTDIKELISTLESFIEYAFSPKNFHYQESIDGVNSYRPSTLFLPNQIPLYEI